MTAADVLVEALLDWGVEVVFGLPGDGINGIIESLRTHQEIHSGSGTKRLPHSWRVAMRSSPLGWASVSPPQGQAEFIF